MAGKVFRYSRYTLSTVVSENEGRLLFVPHRKPLTKTDYPDNIIHTVRASDRIDALSSNYYGEPRYGWVISDFNNFLFPDEDLHEVTTIILPSLITLQTQILPYI